MKLLLPLFASLLLATASGAEMVPSKSNPPPPSSSPAVPLNPATGKEKKPAAKPNAKPAAATPAAPATAPEPAATPATPLKFEDFMKDLSDAAKLTDEQKKEIQNDYLADGVALNGILNDASLSPLQKAKQVADLRDNRNTKIAALFQDADRRSAFFQVEARYRVALTELAANGGLVPAPMPPPAPAAAPATNNAPAQPEKPAEKPAAK